MENLRQKYDNIVREVNSVYDVFSEYYGEERVDLQNLMSYEKYESVGGEISESPFILVWFPETRVTNEHNRFVIIKDVFIKVCIGEKGTLMGTFSVNRATYTKDQYMADYMHSHVLGINKDHFQDFLVPCLGSGPIRSTISSLATKNDSNLWLLFCSEIEDFLKTESIKGVPYRRLENISNTEKISFERKVFYDNLSPINTINRLTNNTIKLLVKDFIYYIFKKIDFRFNYYNNSISLAYSDIDFILKISNEFISWFNLDNNPYRKLLNKNNLIENGILAYGYIQNEKLFQYGVDTCSSVMANGTICKFKNTEIKIQITGNVDTNSGIIILDESIVDFIYTEIIKNVNYFYGKEPDTNSKIYFL